MLMLLHAILCMKFNIICLFFSCNTCTRTCTCRSGKYILNTSTGSDSDLLLNSPGRDKDICQQENSETEHDSTTHNINTPSTSHDPTATPSSNGLEASPTTSDSTSSPEEQRKVLNSNENNCTDSNANTSVAASSNSGCNSEAGSGEGRKVNNEERLPDGEADSEKELQDNFK